MGYSKVFKAERYELIQPVLEKMKRLEKGGKVTAGPFTREQVGTVRGLIYDWLSHMGLKRMFKIRTDYDSGIIEVLNREWPSGAEVKIEESSVKRMDRLLEEALGFEDSEAVVSEWVEEKKITLTEGADLLRKIRTILE